MRKMAAYAIVILAFALYGLSLTLPGLIENRYLTQSNAKVFCPSTNDPAKCMEGTHIPQGAPTLLYGTDILTNGWIGIFAANFGWLGNPFFT